MAIGPPSAQNPGWYTRKAGTIARRKQEVQLPLFEDAAPEITSHGPRGPKLPITAELYAAMRATAARSPGWLAARNVALLSFQLHTSLRAGDVLSVRVAGVLAGGQVQSRLPIAQEKTGVVLVIDLVDSLRGDLAQWLAVYRSLGMRPQWPLWPSSRSWDAAGPRELSYSVYIQHVHRWLELAGVDSVSFGTHSLRSALPVRYYKETRDAVGAQHLFGHRSVSSTARYLEGIARVEAQAVRHRYQFPAPWPALEGEQSNMARKSHLQ